MKAHLKGLELAYRIDPEVPDRLVGDPNRLRQVVLNLVDNAIKFTERGEVIVHVSLRAQVPVEVRLQFTVTDTGIGVSPDKQQRIFKPYDQGGAAVARRYGGTGLGLAVTSRLVRMMGGQIALNSRPGQGSTFGSQRSSGGRRRRQKTRPLRCRAFFRGSLSCWWKTTRPSAALSVTSWRAVT